ncbi:MAG: efflux RND transporter periplasmic adaptor subunit [Geminicoccaceae bacterium]
MGLLLRLGISGLVVGAGAYAAWFLWTSYLLSPQTRDGRVTADIVTVAPEISGRVVELRVMENQNVDAGEVLFVIDPQPFAIAVQDAQANLAHADAIRQLHQSEATRRRNLPAGAVSAEDRQNAELNATAAEAAYQQAEAVLARAKLDLEWTTVRARVPGYITNRMLDLGDYVNAGQPVLAIVDRTSFRVDGYFEETRLRRIRVGAPARVYLMASGPPLTGRVASIARGIGDSDNPTGAQLLLDVKPSFQWVRLAQRIPVRIALDAPPDGVPLVAGMTASVVIEEP